MNYRNLEEKIQNSYLSGISMDEAEKLAGEFLHAQMTISGDIQRDDLDARMRKTGLKTIKAKVYLDEVKKSDKKPSDTLLDMIVSTHEIVIKEQEAYDKAEVEKEELQRLFNIFKEAHVYYRIIAKGGANG